MCKVRYWIAALCVGGLGLLAGRLLLPNNGPCILDWSLVGIWLQAGFVLAGVVVAAFQLKRFNDNGRVKNTLRLYEQYMHTAVLIDQNSPMTMPAALNWLQWVDRNFTEYLALLNRANLGQASQADATLLGNVRTSAIITHNFFDTAAVLLNRHLLDDEVFFDTLGYLTAQSYGLLEKILNADKTLLTGSPLFKRLSEQAQTYKQDHPDRFLVPPKTSESATRT